MTFAKKWSCGVPEFAKTEVNQHFGKTLATHVATWEFTASTLSKFRSNQVHNMEVH